MTDEVGMGATVDDPATHVLPEGRPQRSFSEGEMNVFGALYDFSFKHLVTPRIIKGAYELLVITLTVFAAGLGVYSLIEREWLFVMAVPINYFFLLFAYRVLAEYLIHEFHSSEDIYAIRRNLELSLLRTVPEDLKASHEERSPLPRSDGSRQIASTPLWSQAEPLDASERVIHQFEVASVAGFPGNHRLLGCHCVITDARLFVAGQTEDRRVDVLLGDITKVKTVGTRRKPDLRIEMGERALIFYRLGDDLDVVLGVLSRLIATGTIDDESP